MIDPVNQSVAAPSSQRAAELHRLAMTEALSSLAPQASDTSARSADDTRRLVGSFSMDAAIVALEAEVASNQRAISSADTANATLEKVSALLGQASELTATTASPAQQTKIDTILANVDRLANTTSFAGTKLLDGTMTISASGRRLVIHSVKTEDLGNTRIQGKTYSLEDLGSGKALSPRKPASVEKARAVVRQAMKEVASLRGRIDSFARDTLEPQLQQIASTRDQLLATVSLIHGATDEASAQSSSTKRFSSAMPPGSVLSILA